MSVYAARRAVDWPGGSAVKRHVLLLLGVETDHPRDSARLTLDEIAHKTGLARSTVIQSIRYWLDLGALERHSSRGRTPTEYRVLEPPEPTTNRPLQAVGSESQLTANRPSTDREPTGAERRNSARWDGDGDGEVVPRIPSSGDAVATTGLVIEEDLNQLIAEVSEHRELKLTQSQATRARQRAREALANGWPRDLILAGLVECSAFTPGAFEYAVDQFRRRRRPRQVPIERLSSAERSAEVLRRARTREDGKS
jgi:hypothetical protein